MLLNANRRRLLLFPHETVRPIQDELVIAVDESVRKRKHLVVNAPTGLGKTAASIGPAVAYAIENDLTVFFLTSRHTQHQIALDTIKAIEDRYEQTIPVANLIGKKWMCLQDGVSGMHSGEFVQYCRRLRENASCEYFENLKRSGSLSPDARVAVEKAKSAPAASSVVSIGREHSVCPYEIGLLAARESRVIVTDYFYLFHPRIRESFLAKIGKSLEESIIIVDEAHNLPERIKDLASSRLSTFVLDRAVQEAVDFEYEFPQIGRLKGVLMALAKEVDKKAGEGFVSREDVLELLGEVDVKALLVAGDHVREERRNSYIASVAEFLDEWREEDEGFTRILSVSDSSVSLSRRCLDPGVVSGPLFRECYASVLMSGTLHPTVMYSELLDLPLRTDEYTFQSPFPSSNRLSLIVTKTTTKYTARSSSMFDEQASVLAEIAEATPGNVLVFVPSYALLSEIHERFQTMTSKPVFCESRGMSKSDKASVLSKLESYSSSGAVFLGVTSGSFAEGVDFKGDLAKAVVVVGLPLARPDLETQALMKYYDKKFSRGWDYGYVFPAFNKVLQSAGRVIRSEEEKGALIFLDERYAWANYQRCFPQTWQLVQSDSPGDVVKEFFGVSSQKKASSDWFS
ncbi:MAG: ATP-dependent DNA helicase [Candidatus Woesearchaeota archaeon]